MKDEQEKWVWLRHRLVEFTSRGSVLIFVTRKVNSEEVASSLKGEGHRGMIHSCSELSGSSPDSLSESNYATHDGLTWSVALY